MHIDTHMYKHTYHTDICIHTYTHQDTHGRAAHIYTYTHTYVRIHMAGQIYLHTQQTQM